MKLWQHQQDELPRLLTGNRLLAWEPGTGKTLAVLEAFRKLTENPQALVKRMLVIVPANIRAQWAAVAREAGFSVQVVEKTTEAANTLAQIVVVSYHAVIKPIVFASILRQQWAVVALDEAHYCKNPKTKWTRAIFGSKKDTAKAIFRRADRVWLMTGTPMTTDPSDLWVFASRMFTDMLEAGKIANRQQWITEWCVGYQTPYGFRVTGARNPDRLAKLLSPHMSRVRKADVLATLREPIYDRFRLPPRKIVLDEVADEVRAFMTALDKDEDAALAMAEQPQISTLRRAIGLAKAEEVADLIAEEMSQTDGKALVFFLHTDVGRVLFDKLAKADLRPVIYDGKVSQKARETNKREFITDPTRRVFVGQIHASGTGLDGLQVASRVFIVEEPWTPGALDQVVSRAHRGGQKGTVHVTTFVISESYDDKVSKALENRARMIGQIIDGEAA